MHARVGRMGLDHPATAGAGGKGGSAAPPSSHALKMGRYPEAGIRPRGPLSPLERGQISLC